jgi:hypothetical protein
MSDSYAGAEYISDTNAHTGRFGEIVSLEAGTVIASLTALDYTGNALTSVVLDPSCELCGVFTSITLASGSVVAYRL